jgi:TIR domain-containing protein
MPKIFISYRRVDSAGYTQAIYSRLVQQFSQDEIFIDVDTIAPGADFERAIERAVADCDVLVAVIGKRWITAEPNAPSRFENTKDYVALEISTALARDVHVIPVLVDGTTMPREENLPFPVRPITRRQAIEISNTRFKFDVERLLTVMLLESLRKFNAAGQSVASRHNGCKAVRLGGWLLALSPQDWFSFLLQRGGLNHPNRNSWRRHEKSLLLIRKLMTQRGWNLLWDENRQKRAQRGEP